MAGSQSSSVNALDILESALPISALASIESQFNAFTSKTLAAASIQTSSAESTPSTSQVLSSDRPSNSIPTATTAAVSKQSSSIPSRLLRPSGDPTSSITRSSTASTSNPASASSHTSAPSTLMTVATHPSAASSSATPSATSGAASSTPRLANASVAGIATGLAAGAVVLFLIGLWLWRRRGQGKPPFGAKRTSSGRSSQRSGKRQFPESAWLYDPVRTPHNASPPPEAHHDRSLSTESANPEMASTSNLIPVPEPREGAVELASAPPSPPLDPRASSPLLAPVAPLPRAGSPEGRRSGSRSPRRRSGSGSESPRGRRSRSSLAVSRTDLQRPMSAIWEEPSRPESDARQGLLDPGYINMQRHST